MRILNISIFVAFMSLLLFPELGLATGGISAFETPMKAIVGTITGPVGKAIAVIAVACCGLFYVFNRDDISGAFKLLLTVTAGIVFIAFGGGIVDGLFSFTGALIV